MKADYFKVSVRLISDDFFGVDAPKVEYVYEDDEEKFVSEGVDSNPYVLGNGTQFWGWINFTAEAGKTYWLFSKNGQIGFGGYEFTAAGGESGIATIAAEQKNAPIFNLAGQRVGKNVKGLMIQNGKKFLVK